jgi:hypothetical protein
MPAATAAPGRALAAGLVVTGCLLAGCGGGNPYALPEYDATATGAASGLTGAQGSQSDLAARRARLSDRITRAVTPSPQVKYTPADALGEGAWAERGRIVVGSRAERTVAAAVTRYLSVRVQLSNTWRVDESALAAVASGQAVTSARERAERQRERDRRSIGRFIVNISAVRINGTHATVTGCHFDATSEVDRDGNVLVAPPGGVLITMHLRRTGSTWRVLDWPDRPVPSCDWRA